MPRTLQVFAAVDVLDCRCGRTPTAEMWTVGRPGAAINCHACHARVVELHTNPTDALGLAAATWNNTIKEAARARLATQGASNPMKDAPEPAAETGSAAVGGATVSQGVTAGETATVYRGADWGSRPEGYPLELPWPPSPATGTGARVLSRAARLLRIGNGDPEYVIPQAVLARACGGRSYLIVTLEAAMAELEAQRERCRFANKQVHTYLRDRDLAVAAISRQKAVISALTGAK